MERTASRFYSIHSAFLYAYIVTRLALRFPCFVVRRVIRRSVCEMVRDRRLRIFIRESDAERRAIREERRNCNPFLSLRTPASSGCFYIFARTAAILRRKGGIGRFYCGLTTNSLFSFLRSRRTGVSKD